MQHEWSTLPRAGPGPSSARLMSSVSGGCRLTRMPFKCSSIAQHVAKHYYAAPCCLQLSSTLQHTSSSTSSSTTTGRAPVQLTHHCRAPAARSQVACQAAAVAHCPQPAAASPPQQQEWNMRSSALSSSSSSCRSCASSRSSSSDGYPRSSVRARAASLAIADPTGAATAAVASAAVATASSLSFSKIVAVVLGYAVMAGSLFRSVPQIMKVLQHGSTEGLSLTSYIVELCCYSVTIAYNINQGYCFNTFGEVCACWAQDIILIALIFRFSKTKKWIAAVTGLSIAAGCTWLLSPCCPHSVLAALQASNILTMALGSRLPQIILNMRRGNAGVLSVTTCLLNVAGNAARVFTTIVLTGDMLILGGYFSQGTLNSILLCQSIGTSRQRSKAAAAAAAAAGGQQQQQQQEKLVGPKPQPGPQALEPESAPSGLMMQPAT